LAGSRRPRGRFLLLLLVLLGLTFVTLSERSSTSHYFNKVRSLAREVANPFQSGVHAALQPVGDFIYGALQYRSLEAQNRQLRLELKRGATAYAQSLSAEQQAAQVLSQEHLTFVPNIPSIAAEVVQVGSSNYEETVQIDRGSANGVAVGQPVVSAGGLVGSVSLVSAHLATVTLIDDPTSVVGVRDVHSGVVGAAKGEGLGFNLQVEDLNVGDTIKRGDQLVTSGLTLEDFPAGIPVGTVTSVSSGTLTLQVSLKPLVNLSNLQFVRVLLWSPQGG
jgi:rod shape-determining protein MreC